MLIPLLAPPYAAILLEANLSRPSLIDRKGRRKIRDGVHRLVAIANPAPALGKARYPLDREAVAEGLKSRFKPA